MSTPLPEIEFAPRISVKIQEGPVDVIDELQLGAHPDLGALSVFVGQVRDHDPEAGETPVVGIDYVAHPEAEKILEEEISNLAREAWAGHAVEGGTPFVTVVHRVGKLSVGDIAMLVISGGAHRQPGMSLTPKVVERVKEILPVWKKQGLSDGTDKWSNLP